MLRLLLLGSSGIELQSGTSETSEMATSLFPREPGDAMIGIHLYTSTYVLSVHEHRYEITDTNRNCAHLKCGFDCAKCHAIPKECHNDR